MKKGWERKRLSDLYQIGSSKRVLKSQWKTEGVPFYRGREVTRLAADGFVDNELFIAEKHFAELAKEYGVPKAGDIVITAIGTIGNSHVVRNFDRFYFKDASVLWMKRTAEVSSEFVNFWLKSTCFFDQLDRGNGATVDTLTIQKLQSVEISVPPLAEQQRIVGLLDEALAGLATAQAHAEQNLQNARALFESHLQSVFTQRGKGWSEAILGELIEIQNGYAFKSSEYTDSGHFVIRISNVQNGEITLDNPRYINLTGKNLERFVLNAGDILISLTGNIGRVGVLQEEHLPAVLNQRVARITIKDQRADRDFVFRFLCSQVFREKLQGAGHGAAQQNVSAKEIESVKISIPNIREQRRIVEEFDGFVEETQRLAALYTQKLAALAALKQSLLHQAFAGEL